MITAFPATIAALAMPVRIASGKFQGAMMTPTPRGHQCWKLDSPATICVRFGRPKRTQMVAGESNFQHWWPRRVGVINEPWNFPLAILTGMASAAIVAGNAVIIKPSDQTPVIGARLMDLFIEAGLPPG